MKVVDLLQEIAVNLVDASNDTWTKEELLTYYIAAISFVVSVRPDACTKTEDFTCAEGAFQNIPSDSLRLIDVIFNKASGSPINNIDRSSLDNRFGDWYQPATLSDDVEHFVFDDRVPTEFYLHPAPNAGIVLRAVFSKLPESPVVADFDTDINEVPLSLIYHEPIRFYVMYRAFMKEAPSQDIAKASNYFSAANNLLGVKTNSDTGISPNKQVK